MSLTACASPLPDPSLEGRWGGDRAQLTVVEGQGQLSMECGGGSIKGPIKLNADGRFEALGYFEQQRPGPQRADETPAGARYAGHLQGQSLTLQVWSTAGAPPLVLHLRKGVQAKMVRCL